MRINDLLYKDNNNLNLFKLLYAIIIIFNHSFQIDGWVNPSSNYQVFGPMKYIFYTAVPFFAFISGLFVSETLYRKKNITQFIIQRITRLYIPYMIAILMCAFIFGPLITKLDLKEYYVVGAGTVAKYIFNNAKLSVVLGGLPGVNFINGSIWCMPIFFCGYLYILALHCFGVLKENKWSTIVVLATIIFVIIDYNSSTHVIPYKYRINDIRYVAGIILSFLFGVLFFTLKNKIDVNKKLVLGTFCLYLFRISPLHYFLKVAFILSLVMYLSKCERIRKINVKHDLFIPLFLIGQPFQWVFATFYPQLGPYKNFIATMLLALPFSIIWIYTVEKACSIIGKYLNSKFSKDIFGECEHYD